MTPPTTTSIEKRIASLEQQTRAEEGIKLFFQPPATDEDITAYRKEHTGVPVLVFDEEDAGL